MQVQIVCVRKCRTVELYNTHHNRRNGVGQNPDKQT